MWPAALTRLLKRRFIYIILGLLVLVYIFGNLFDRVSSAAICLRLCYDLLLECRRAPSVDYIMMSTKCNGYARYSGNSSCCHLTSILIVRGIGSYIVAIQFRADSCWPTSVVSSAYANSCCPMVAAIWSFPISATIAAAAATLHRTVAQSMNTVYHVACIRTSNRCWKRCSKQWIHKNTYTPAWSITSSCA